MNEDDKKYWRKEEKDGVAYSIIRHMKDIQEIASQAIEAFTHDFTPEEVLTKKSEFLIRIIDSFPLNKLSCTFCAIQCAKYDDSEAMNDTCSSCAYAKTNGYCDTSGSSYNTIINAIHDVRKALQKYPLQA